MCNTASTSLLIVNPISGQGRVREAKARIIERLRELGPLDVTETRAAGDANSAAGRAIEQGIRRIVVAGGDGTVNEVINAIAGEDVELALVPQGTGNVLARELGIPVDDVEKACDIIAAGQSVPMDLARANGRYFALMAGVGFDAAVVDRVDRDVKDLLGPAAYGLAGLEELLWLKTSHFVITMDGHRYETDASLVIVANISSYALRVKIASHASYNDGWLDVCVFQTAKAQRTALINQALRLILQGTHEGDPSVRCFRAANVRIESDPPVRVQVDGDLAGETPIDIQIAPSAIRVIAPNGQV